MRPQRKYTTNPQLVLIPWDYFAPTHDSSWSFIVRSFVGHGGAARWRSRVKRNGPDYMIVVGLARIAGRALAREVLDDLPRPEGDDSGECDEGEGFADHGILLGGTGSRRSRSV